MKILEVATGKELFTFSLGDGGSVPGVEFNATGSHVVASGSTAFVAFKISNGEKTVIDPSIGWVAEYRFSADGRFMAAGGMTGIIIWDARTWKELRRIGGDAVSGDRGHVAFTRDSKYVAAIDNSGRLHFWDPATGADVLATGEGLRPDGQLEFTPDGRVMAAGADGQVHVFGPGGGASFKQAENESQKK